MSSHKEILRQIGELTETLGQVFAEEYRGAAAEAQARADELAAELAKVRAGEEEALAARQALEHELETAEKRIETLVQKLKDARQAAAEAAEEAQRALRRQLEALEEECDDARAELEQERSVRKRLEKGAAADEKRLRELEKELDEKGRAAPSVDADDRLVAVADAGLRDERDEALAALEEERQARACSEDELTQAHKLIEGLEKALKQTQEASRAPAGASDVELRKLTDQLRTAEARLEQEQRDGQRKAEACAAAERRVAELEELLHARETAPASPAGVAVPGRKPVGEAPLPHELRPAPKPGTLFRPDWDLTGLPCKSPEQVLQAWASVFNVQLSLEGYPSQYCAAFLVVLKVGKQKQLFVVFNLKASKHVLVCVPSKPPADEASLGKMIEEGRKYLLMSGFELEKVAAADMQGVLGTYMSAD